MNAFDLTVKALREQGLNSDEILEELSILFQKLAVVEKQPVAEENAEAKIRILLKELGMHAYGISYECWVKAILLYNTGKNKTLYIDIYPKVAKDLGIDSAKAERRMRRAVERVFTDIPVEVIDAMFERHTWVAKGKLTNSQFIAIMSEKI